MLELNNTQVNSTLQQAATPINAVFSLADKHEGFDITHSNCYHRIEVKKMRQDAGFLNSVSCQDPRPTTSKIPYSTSLPAKLRTCMYMYVPTSKHACLKSSMSLFPVFFFFRGINIISTI